MVTEFVDIQSFTVPENLTFSGLAQFLDQMIGYPNLVQAIRIDGHFKEILVRGVPKQSLPYRSLGNILKTDETRHEHKNVEGTLVGFKVPEFMKGLNVAGYHFHFIDNDRNFGGHVLELLTDTGIVKLNQATHLEVQLPR